MSKIHLFISDVHLNSGEKEAQKQSHLLTFLNSIDAEEVEALYILGDLFDFWLEYKSAIFYPYFKVLKALAQVKEKGIEVHLILGNHEMGSGPFLEEEVGLKVHQGPLEISLNGQRLFLCHGDGLNPHDRGYLFLKRYLRKLIPPWLMRLVHPDLLALMAKRASAMSRKVVQEKDRVKELQAIENFAMKKFQEGTDVFLAGHAHLPAAKTFFLEGKVKHYFNLGDWQEYFTFVIYEEGQFSLKTF